MAKREFGYDFSSILGSVLMGSIAVLGFFMIIQTVFGANISTSVIVGNASPSVTSVVLNNGTAITLTENATTAIRINFTVTDNNGCGDAFFNGGTTTTVFRAAAGAACTASNLNCYIVSTSTHNCPSALSTTTSANATATVEIYYFADATDSSSSYPAQDWVASVSVKDSAAASNSATSTHRELNTLTAINITTTSINYGSVSAGTDTGATNQTATTTNAGNSSTTLQLRASATLVSGSNSIATTSQRYATSSFTFAGGATQLTESNVTVTSFLLLTPTSTTNVSKTSFWGLEVPSGTATGTYSGTTVFSALFQP